MRTRAPPMLAAVAAAALATCLSAPTVPLTAPHMADALVAETGAGSKGVVVTDDWEEEDENQGLHAAISRDEAIEYLSRFGYLPEESRAEALWGSGGRPPPARVSRALADLQAFAGLDVTGMLDAETQALMRRPRCGNRDLEPEEELEEDELILGLEDDPKPRLRRRRRYVEQGSRWPTTRLSYRVKGAPARGGLDAAGARSDVAAALRLWSNASALRFRPRARGAVHLKMSFERRSHGCGKAFDGPGGVLAHAFFPAYGGATHFDADERFSAANTTNGVSLRQTAAHEVGHALGLDHSSVSSALMAPFYRHNMPNPSLHRDDIAGIQALYGKPPPTPPPLTTTTKKKKPEAEKDEDQEEGDEAVGLDEGAFAGRVDEALCEDPSVDCAFATGDGSLHVFKGENHYVLAEGGGVVHGYPQAVAATWREMPSRLDTGFTYKAGGPLLVFAGGRVWRYRQSQLARGFPVAMSRAFRGVPSSIDAAFWSPNDGKIYLFKGPTFWTVDPRESPLRGRQRPLSSWKGLPDKGIDAVLVDGNRSFAFAGQKHYLLDERHLRVAVGNPPYPRDNGPRWFGCPSEQSLPLTAPISSPVAPLAGNNARRLPTKRLN